MDKCNKYKQYAKNFPEKFDGLLQKADREAQEHFQICKECRSFYEIRKRLDSSLNLSFREKKNESDRSLVKNNSKKIISLLFPRSEKNDNIKEDFSLWRRIADIFTGSAFKLALGAGVLMLFFILAEKFYFTSGFEKKQDISKNGSVQNNATREFQYGFYESFDKYEMALGSDEAYLKKGDVLFCFNEKIKSKSRPFKIKTDYFEIEIIGTSLRVKAGHDSARASVKSGTVKLYFKNSVESINISAGQNVFAGSAEAVLTDNSGAVLKKITLKRSGVNNQPEKAPGPDAALAKSAEISVKRDKPLEFVEDTQPMELNESKPSDNTPVSPFISN